MNLLAHDIHIHRLTEQHILGLLGPEAEELYMWNCVSKFKRSFIVVFVFQAGQREIEGCHQFVCRENRLEKVPISCTPCDVSTRLQ